MRKLALKNKTPPNVSRGRSFLFHAGRRKAISPRFVLTLEFCTAFPQVTRNGAGGLNTRHNRSSGCLLATLNCSSAGGEPIVTQTKMPKSVAVKIVMAISLRFIDSGRRL